MTADENERCCHETVAVHVAEVALLATLIVEHNALGALLDRITRSGAARRNLLDAAMDAHGNATAALKTWKATSLPPISADWTDWPEAPDSRMLRMSVRWTNGTVSR
jgi:hypothetical protein